jgi:hypothetical protein
MSLPNFCRIVRGRETGISLPVRMWLAVFCLTGLLGTIGSASAQTITLYSNSGNANTLPANIPFTTLSLGTNSTANTLVQTSTVTTSSTKSAPAKLPSGTEISSIAFGTQGSTSSGVFAGGVSGQAASPFGSSNTKTDFLVAGASGSVTVSYTVTQDALQILWGSVDGAATNNNNVVTFMNGSTVVGTVNGAQIAAAVGSGFVSGTTNVALRISGLPGFTSVVLSDPGAAAFEFDLGLPVPEPAAIGLFVVAVAGLGFVTFRAKKRQARAAG